MKTNNRNYGIDLLKIFAMIGIIVLHINGQGGILNNSLISKSIYLFSQFTELLFYSCVNIFAIISGYLMYKKEKFNSYRVFELISTIIFYMIFLSIIYYALYPSVDNNFITLFIKNFELLSSSYWYIINYLPLLILSPFINKLISILNIKQFSLFCNILFLLFSLIPTILETDIFKTKFGYSFIWLLICYIFGAYLNRKNISINNKMRSVFCIFLNIAFVLLINYILMTNTNSLKFTYLYKYCSPFILFNAIFVFLIFKDINLSISKKHIKNIIVLFSNATFDVYIIHTHFLFYDYLLKDKFIFAINKNPIFLPFILFGSSIILFLIFAIIGVFRIKLFKKIKLKKAFDTITKEKLSYSIEQ